MTPDEGGDERALLEEERARLGAEIAAEKPGPLSPLLAWVDGTDDPDPATAARERLDIAPLVCARVNQLTERVRAVGAVIPAEDLAPIVLRFREAAIRALFRELTERCQIRVSFEETRRRFLAAWDR